jgi:hypothetical protein
VLAPRRTDRWSEQGLRKRLSLRLEEHEAGGEGGRSGSQARDLRGDDLQLESQTAEKKQKKRLRALGKENAKLKRVLPTDAGHATALRPLLPNGWAAAKRATSGIRSLS